jgi:hypothetical protein
MFALVVIAILNGSPINKNDGSLVMYFKTRPECLQAKDEILSSWKIKSYRISAGCVYVPEAKK